MQYVYQAPSLNSFKKPILHKQRETGPFFLGSLVGMTDYWYRRGCPTPHGFWYCTKQSANVCKRGTLYQDMMSGADNIAVKLHPTPSTQVMKTIDTAISRRIPPRPLILTNEGGGHERNKHLDHVSAKVSEFKRAQGPSKQYVPLYVRPHQLNEGLASMMVSNFRRLDRIWKVDYDLENITNDIWGYRVKIFVN